MRHIIINITNFQVYNILPSISAITGISPQRYLWRISIALHMGPRLVIAIVYYSYYRKILKAMEDVPKKIVGCRLLNLCFWLNIAEIASLSGVTYISNRENYCESQFLPGTFYRFHCTVFQTGTTLMTFCRIDEFFVVRF